MKVSIVLTVKNEARNVDKLMISIRSQTYSLQEIIIVDASCNDEISEKLFE